MEKTWAQRMDDFWKNRRSEPPYRTETYQAIRGGTWMVLDGKNNHIATVFEENDALLIVQRLNG